MESAADIASADKLVFPGVGAFGQAMEILQQRGYVEALRDYIHVRREGLAVVSVKWCRWLGSACCTCSLGRGCWAAAKLKLGGWWRQV